MYIWMAKWALRCVFSISRVISLSLTFISLFPFKLFKVCHLLPWPTLRLLPWLTRYLYNLFFFINGVSIALAAHLKCILSSLSLISKPQRLLIKLWNLQRNQQRNQQHWKKVVIAVSGVGVQRSSRPWIRCQFPKTLSHLLVCSTFEW